MIIAENAMKNVLMELVDEVAKTIHFIDAKPSDKKAIKAELLSSLKDRLKKKYNEELDDAYIAAYLGTYLDDVSNDIIKNSAIHESTDNLDEDFAKDYEKYQQAKTREQRIQHIKYAAQRGGSSYRDPRGLNTTKEYELTDDITCTIKYEIDDDKGKINKINITVEYTGDTSRKLGWRSDRESSFSVYMSDLDDGALKKIRRNVIQIASQWVDDDDKLDEIIDNSKDMVNQISKTFGSFLTHRYKRLKKLDDLEFKAHQKQFNSWFDARQSYGKENKIEVGSKIIYKGDPATVVDDVTDKDTGVEYWKVKFDKNGRSKKIQKSELNYGHLKDFKDKFSESTVFDVANNFLDECDSFTTGVGGTLGLNNGIPQSGDGKGVVAKPLFGKKKKKYKVVVNKR